MTLRNDDRHLRQYVLGASSEAECDEIERVYFDDADTLDQLRAAEDDLIDDYLSDRLAREERDRFEQHYLATPGHRTRVKVARELRRRSGPSSAAGITVGTITMGRWMAIAAGVSLLVAGTWLVRSRIDRTPQASVVPTTSSASPGAPTVAVRPAAPEPVQPRDTPPAAPIVALMTLSPIHVRSADQTASLVIPPATDLVVLQLQEDRGERRLDRGEAIIRTVAGHEVWRGPAVETARTPVPIARIEVPASTLPVDDYIVELRGAAADGGQVERYRYFLRIRR